MFAISLGLNARPRYYAAVPRVTVLKAVLWVTCANIALSITGCGAGSTTPADNSPSPNSLNGNWLLLGSLPFLSPTQHGNGAFGVSMTFSLVGDQIAAGGSIQVPCGQSSGTVTTFSSYDGGGIALSGSVATNGSFTAQTPATQPTQLPVMQIQGSVPSNGASSWSGSYSFLSNNSTCPFSETGTFTAVRIADLTGSYSGSGFFYPASGASGGNGQPVNVELTLQQGQATQTQSIDEAVVAGSVEVQGVSCFSTGQIASQPKWQSNLLGTQYLATFTMDDGSQLLLSANIEDTLSSRLGVASMLVSGGKCDRQFIGPFELSRQ